MEGLCIPYGVYGTSDAGDVGFGILLVFSGPTRDCSLAGQTSGFTYSQIVPAAQKYDGWVVELTKAVTGGKRQPGPVLKKKQVPQAPHKKQAVKPRAE